VDITSPLLFHFMRFAQGARNTQTPQKVTHSQCHVTIPAVDTLWNLGPTDCGEQLYYRSRVPMAHSKFRQHHPSDRQWTWMEFHALSVADYRTPQVCDSWSPNTRTAQRTEGLNSPRSKKAK